MADPVLGRRQLIGPVGLYDQGAKLLYLVVRQGESMDIRRAMAGDAEQVAEIYNWYILNTIVTFETDVLSPHEVEKRIQETNMKHEWLVGEVNQELIGYAYYGPFRGRAAYHHTVESTIYLSQESIGKGFGRVLYGKLIESIRDRGFREVIGVIALPNPQSIVLHQMMGFAEVGVLKGVGYKFGRYIDVGIWQLRQPAGSDADK
ncbi:MAG TPA: GNAT family N-acetyltransferase [Candidatus Binatia bacterium]|nr:GNAT family N-acetyltransferase [Candidatus Binatia bacterium]